MTAAGAEILLVGMLVGFFVSQVVQYFVTARSRTASLPESAYAQLEEVVEQALARRLAAGAVVAAAPTAAAPAAKGAVDTEAEAKPAAK
ncbi:MAG: hypothetical protein DIU82_09150, partial [Bacillota bacterium]